MEHEDDRYNFDGAQIPLIGFDQLEHFTEKQFFYLLSRNRSTCGISPYIRATANPDPDSFLTTFLEWWIDQVTGYAIPEHAGVIRFFIRLGDEIFWANSNKEAIELGLELGLDPSEIYPLSVTFIPAQVDDNPTILEKDPAYKAKLAALQYVERERLQRGNWKIRPAAGNYFKRDYFNLLTSVPDDITRTIRFWDLASTEPKKANRGRHSDPDWTVGFKLGKRKDGTTVILHIQRFRATAYQVEKKIKETAEIDGKSTTIGIAQDPGQAGKSQIDAYSRVLSGYTFKSLRETGDKETRAAPFSSQAEHGNVSIIKAPWNEAWYQECENFPESKFKDQVDAGANAYNMITGARRAGTWGRKTRKVLVSGL